MYILINVVYHPSVKIHKLESVEGQTLMTKINGYYRHSFYWKQPCKINGAYIRVLQFITVLLVSTFNHLSLMGNRLTGFNGF